MNKKIIAVLTVLLALFSINASFAKSEFVNDLINANKKVLNNAAQAQKAKVDAKVQAQIDQYQKQIDAKQAEISKIEANKKYTVSEKYKKIKAIRDDINELKAEIKKLK